MAHYLLSHYGGSLYGTTPLAMEGAIGEVLDAPDKAFRYFLEQAIEMAKKAEETSGHGILLLAYAMAEVSENIRANAERADPSSATKLGKQGNVAINATVSQAMCRYLLRMIEPSLSEPFQQKTDHEKIAYFSFYNPDAQRVLNMFNNPRLTDEALHQQLSATAADTQEFNQSIYDAVYAINSLAEQARQNRGKSAHMAD